MKVYDSAMAMVGYTPLICHCSFSVADISGALGDCESASLVVGDGCKMVRIAARGNGLGPVGSALLFTLPIPFTEATVKQNGVSRKVNVAGEKGYGGSIEASVTSGVFVVSSGSFLQELGRRDYENSRNGIIFRPHPGKA